MGVIKCRGLIINEFALGEADKILTLLTKEYGKIKVSAKGARKIKSRYMSGSRLFTYADFVLFAGTNFYSVTQIDIIESFKNISSDFEKMCYGNYFLEIIDKTTFENEPNDNILKLVLKALQVLDKGKIEPQVVARAFDFKFMQLSGYTPELASCVLCEKQLAQDDGLFTEEGLICTDCSAQARTWAPICYTAIYAINYILNSGIKDIFSFNVSEKTLSHLKSASYIFMNNFDIKLKSREILDDVFKN